MHVAYRGSGRQEVTFIAVDQRDAAITNALVVVVVVIHISHADVMILYGLLGTRTSRRDLELNI
jgi:hypothetical protein